MPNDSKLVKLIRLLIRETTEGKIKWDAENAPRSRQNGTDDIIEEYFTTEFKEQKIAVFERRYQGFNAETESLYWTSANCFAFVDGSGEITWETETQPMMIGNLFNVAKESAADVDGILDSLLS
jgi:hypothetical protein